jgi:uncharacterized Zn finger protein
MAARSTPLAGNGWARRWMSALDGFGWAARLARGRSYARGGRVLDIEIAPGQVRARVQGSRPTPYRVQMGVDTFEDAVWDRVIGALARQAIYVAKMLAGDLPAEVVQLCEVAEAPLFPDHPDDIRMSCSCPDWAVPCKHVAAVHYALAAELDRDPFLLFRLRGRTREELTSALRARRVGLGGNGGLSEPESADVAGDAADDEDQDDAQPLPVERFWQAGSELDDLHFEIRSPDVPGAVLRLLGPPPAWGSHDDLLARLHDLYRIASASVRDAALVDVDRVDDGPLDDER